MNNKDYQINLSKQQESIYNFLKLHNIKSSYYNVGGCGVLDEPFYEESKRRINLAIEMNENIKEQLCEKSYEDEHGNKLYILKNNSEILKEFQDYCIKEKIIVNLYNSDDSHRYVDLNEEEGNNE